MISFLPHSTQLVTPFYKVSMGLDLHAVLSEVDKPFDDHPMKCRLSTPASYKFNLPLYLGPKKYTICY